MSAKNYRKTCGALCFALGGVQYLLAEKITALSWVNPFYSYAANFISDLGVAQCGVMQDGRNLCSPLHAVMNGGFAFEGVLFFIACWLLRPLFTGAASKLFLLFGFLHGLGGVLIAFFHSDPQGTMLGSVSMHQSGAVLAIVGGNLTLLCAGWSQWNKPQWCTFSRLSWVLGMVGLLNVIILMMGLLPTGIAERGSVYTITFWQIFTGFYLLARGEILWRTV
ncbi:DUF998 domain-containing protein [Ewingella americana]|jgi:hypothetical membrane protein|uniref:DUF998 domain-containing protein n=1 Tax=Ewingella americana TaxID=41202 RepID=A0A502GRC8_9GAMM|nr:DUF998 domain-containing protein [Ewingella americana]TPG64709.1 DUF998 domain-containing protein [Ewingella americana]